jgi:hypothetical protein
MVTSKGKRPREKQRGEAPMVTSKAGGPGETTIYKEVFFDASHRLLHYEGKCRNLHGHRWRRIRVWESDTCCAGQVYEDQ